MLPAGCRLAACAPQSAKQVASNAEDNCEHDLVRKFSVRKLYRWSNRSTHIISTRLTRTIFRTPTNPFWNELPSQPKAKIATNAFANCEHRSCKFRACAMYEWIANVNA